LFYLNQNSQFPHGQHGLSCSKRPDHQQVMPSGSGNLVFTWEAVIPLGSISIYLSKTEIDAKDKPEYEKAVKTFLGIAKSSHCFEKA
jgi:hypothetical protein